MIRGKEINEQQQPKQPEQIEPIADEFISCCACFIEMEKQNSNLPSEQTEVLVNFDDYRMDSNGDLPTEPVIPALDENESDASSTKRICSPNTAQIIRITMNSRTSKDDE